MNKKVFTYYYLYHYYYYYYTTTGWTMIGLNKTRNFELCFCFFLTDIYDLFGQF